MKKLLASLLASLLAAGGFVFLDATIPNRVEMLEKEVSSLREEVSMLSEKAEGYSVGDEIPCFPKTSFSLHDWSWDKTVVITDFSAKITQVTSEPDSFGNAVYPYRGVITIKGTADSNDAGNIVCFDFDGTVGKIDFPNDGIVINDDGSFAAEIPFYSFGYIGKNVVLAVTGVSFVITIQSHVDE